MGSMGIPLTTPASRASHTAPRASNASTVDIFLGIGKTFLHVVAVYLVLLAITTAIHFPYHTDAVVPASIKQSASKLYEEIYAGPLASVTTGAEQEADPADLNAAEYKRIAQFAIDHDRIVPRVTQFVRDMGLADKRVLDVGAGTGYLQDLVTNYVGLDISPTARRYFHKPFVEASATDMPFRDGEFDGLWSIWVLEHVPDPEQALLEMRRVVKDGGLLYLLPAWNCTPWAGAGYAVRPYQDFGLQGKLIK